MADLTFGIKGSIINTVVGAKISDTDAPRIVAYLVNLYGGNGESPSEVVEKFANGILQGLLNETVAFEREAAAKEASLSVQDITKL